MDSSSRKEPFRYVMNQPIDCWLEIPEGPGSGKLTEAVLLDLSHSGCKVRTSLNLRFTAGDTKLIIHFHLNEVKLQFEGSVRWGWMFGLGQYQYGIRLDLTEDEEELLLRELDLWSSGRSADSI
ncbi:PilZ domain-containing protein [Paenibacillus donghaensis]|uniref:PilZ domain-containing protein n=1 Tax=Paenibacillus donghaensis TaxID=414771 RepID=A0A2Z2KDY4_9BACL|nr:PilZ domain-containing protein [Paenibacillus donghaensis]ASA21263.1 PilZ domain-containing protein [Paenibacillus donghaensis]